jgi:cytochrome c peroxidase
MTLGLGVSKNRRSILIQGIMSLFLLLCPDMEVHGQEALTALPKAVKTPQDNPFSADKAALGKLLFWDPILSGNKDVACASCHHPRFGYAEDRDLSIGVNGIGLGEDRRFQEPNTIPFVKRNSQTLLNVAFNGIDRTGQYDPATAPMFWDMRVMSLEMQALEPIKAFEEMRGNTYPKDNAVEAVVARLNAIPEYRALFAKAFGGNAASPGNLGKALATFERTLLANNSPFDRYMRGDRSAMTSAQIEGMQRFESTGCTNCHNGPMFSDYKPHVLGVPDNPKVAESDSGMNNAPYAFRTASLRNLGFTAPYMHNGMFRTLGEVVRFYRRAPRNPNVERRDIDPLVRQLRRPGRAADEIVEFLAALNDDSFDKAIPSRVPSGLIPGGRIQ